MISENLIARTLTNKNNEEAQMTNFKSRVLITMLALVFYPLPNLIQAQEQVLYEQDGIKLLYKATNLNFQIPARENGINGKEVNLSLWKLEMRIINNSGKMFFCNSAPQASIEAGKLGFPNYSIETKYIIKANDIKNAQNQGAAFETISNNNSFAFSITCNTGDWWEPHVSFYDQNYIFLPVGETPIIERWDMGSYTLKDKSKNAEDDFWSGKENNNEAAKSKDDFWNGGNDNIKSGNGFWNGNGTSNEEQLLEQNTKADLEDKYIGNVRSRTRYIKIFCWDTGEEDGDVVRIFHNGKQYKPDILLTNNGGEITLNLSFGQNEILIYAKSTGRVGPNTAAFKIYDQNSRMLTQSNWKLQEGNKGKFLILRID